MKKLTFEEEKELVNTRFNMGIHPDSMLLWRPNKGLSDIREIIKTLTLLEYDVYSFALFRIWKNEVKKPEWVIFNHIPPAELCWRALIKSMETK